LSKALSCSRERTLTSLVFLAYSFPCGQCHIPRRVVADQALALRRRQRRPDGGYRIANRPVGEGLALLRGISQPANKLRHVVRGHIAEAKSFPEVTMRVGVQQPAVFLSGVLTEPPPPIALVAVNPFSQKVAEPNPAASLELAAIPISLPRPLDHPGLLERPRHFLALLAGSSIDDDVGPRLGALLLEDPGSSGPDELGAHL
jgi:hypothetical protein